VEIYLYSHNTPSWCGAQLQRKDVEMSVNNKFGG